MRAPEFWAANGPPARLLAPAGELWGLAGRLRRRLATEWRAPVPVICVGNLVAGGAGKTLVALAIGEALAARRAGLHFLSRGHGGRLRGPRRVDPARDTAAEVGDEPLLLARVAPTWIARDRAAGARAAAAAGARVVVMDDGFQNPALAKDLALIVVDGAVGFGNGRLIPAGPLREPVAAGLARADAVVIVGADATGVVRGLAGRVPVLRAEIAPREPVDDIAGRRVLAFAGIGRPGKLYETLRSLGCDLVATRDFPDHHRYRPEEVMALVEAAQAAGALAVTTEKDAVRLAPEARAMVRALPVALDWRGPEPLEAMLAAALAAAPGP